MLVYVRGRFLIRESYCSDFGVAKLGCQRYKGATLWLYTKCTGSQRCAFCIENVRAHILLRRESINKHLPEDKMADHPSNLLLNHDFVQPFFTLLPRASSLERRPDCACVGK